MLAGLSSLGVKLGYGTGTSASTATYSVLHRINSIGGINIEPETIDASALEDFVERTIAGRASTGGQWTISFNLTDETKAEWEAVMTAYEGLTTGNKLYLQVDIPDLTDGFFVSVQTPKQFPLPEVGQNELLVAEMQLTMEEVVGFETKVTMTDSEA